ncbi:C3a anaphylatoxin chemotactic receptor-like [Pseudorasbora parva]|uniref:C3a anaphylatoxin chemotactic receptor-like n=1 Tax=Pseudorasbora parva TaxID=51549 RepID=UPI00351E7D38
MNGDRTATTTFGFHNVTRFATDNSTVQREIYIICINLAMSAVGLIGNGLVIFVTGYKMKTTVNSTWFLNLACADFICNLFLIIRNILEVCKGVFVNFKGIFLHFMMYQNSFASILLLTTISMDRCLCAWLVVWARNNRTLFKARIICMIVWVVSIVCCIPYYKFLVHYKFIVGFLIPFLIIVSSYIAIGVRVKRLQKENQLRSYRVIVAVVLAFFICWLPYHVHKFMCISAVENQWSKSSKDVLLKTADIVDYLVYLNSCLNPILYVFICDEYKKKLKQSLLLVLETAFAEDHLDIKVSKQTKVSTISMPARCLDNQTNV